MEPKRRRLLKSLAALSAGLAVPSNQAENPAAAEGTATHAPLPAKRPNILVFFSDDHARWLQQAYGNSEVRTPNMERIARSGVLLRNAHTVTPVCSPARASFFTGRMPSQHGIHDWIEETTQAYAYPWLQNEILLSELLKQNGYHTGLVGKWHCGAERERHRGFDEWYSYWVSQYPHDGEQNFSDNGRHLTRTGFQAPFFTERAIHFLQSHFASSVTAHSPFFLFVGYTDTHTPHAQMPAALVDEYAQATFRDIPHETFSRDHGKALIPVSDAITENQKRRQYYAAASSIDREVGKILDTLDALAQTANTLLIYTGDHGLNAGHHGIWEKGNATIPQNFLEESVGVACAVSWPEGGVAEGLGLDIPVNHCDLFATILDAAGAMPAETTRKKINSPGRSYLSHLRGKPAEPWREDVFCEYGNARMVKHQDYKLVVRYPYQGMEFANEFYDLKADPRETVNVYKLPEHRERIERMQVILDDYFNRYSEPGHDGRHLEHQPMCTPASPWLAALKQRGESGAAS